MLPDTDNINLAQCGGTDSLDQGDCIHQPDFLKVRAALG